MKKHAITGIKGAAMGMAEVVPGVSGGTIAFITGIYETLINTIKSLTPQTIRLLLKGKLNEFFKAINGIFLFPLLMGMIGGIVIGVFGISYLLHNFPLPVWAFFFGLILASSIHIAKQISSWSLVKFIVLIAFAVLGYFVTIIEPTQSSDSLLWVFFCGMLAISALMLPGLSGSFILLLLNMYEPILGNVKEMMKEQTMTSIITTLVFMSGCLVGMLSFSRVLSWAFKNFKDLTLVALTGLLLGSLNKVWPWQEVLATRIGSSGEEKIAFTKSVSPAFFETLSNNFLYGNEAQTVAVCLAAIAGFALVLGMERFSAPKEA
jgi:putative membrane protein